MGSTRKSRRLLQFMYECFCSVMYIFVSSYVRTTYIETQKWPQTNRSYVEINNSCVVPLIETDIEIGDRHYIWRQNGVKGYDLKVILIPENYTVVYMFDLCYNMFLF